MSSRAALRAVPVEDRAWLMAALADALEGGSPVFPVPPGTEPETVRWLKDQPLPEGTAVIVRTSGSSGVPKTVALSAAALQASAAATNEALASREDPGASGSRAGQWLVALPGHLISGLQMLVRSRLAGTEPVFFDGRFDPAALLAAAEQMDRPRRYVSLVPVQLARLLDLAEADAAAADALRGFAAVLVGGQSTPLALRQRAHELGVALRRSYGMTETAGGCVYDGVEIGDTRVRIRGGEVQIAGSCLALGYVGDVALTAERFPEERGRAGAAVRWYRTGDAGELLGGMLRVTGRLDRVIVSGGVNVSLDEIERIAGEQPGWEGVVAVAIADAEWGERPILVRERPAAGGGPTEGAGARPFSELRALLREALGPAAAPEWAAEVEELPRLAGGKPDRAALGSLVGRMDRGSTA